jgi:hypothetical protein
MHKMSETINGQDRLFSIDETDKPITIQKGSGKNHLEFDNGNDATAKGKPDFDGNPGSGKGSGSTLAYDPAHEPPIPSSPANKRPSDVGLYQGLATADHAGHGELDTSPDEKFPFISKEDVRTGQESNKYRAERGVPPAIPVPPSGSKTGA